MMALGTIAVLAGLFLILTGLYIRRVDPAAEQLFGYREDELLGNSAGPHV